MTGVPRRRAFVTSASVGLTADGDAGMRAGADVGADVRASARPRVQPVAPVPARVDPRERARQVRAVQAAAAAMRAAMTRVADRAEDVSAAIVRADLLTPEEVTAILAVAGVPREAVYEGGPGDA